MNERKRRSIELSRRRAEAERLRRLAAIGKLPDEVLEVRAKCASPLCDERVRRPRARYCSDKCREDDTRRRNWILNLLRSPTAQRRIKYEWLDGVVYELGRVPSSLDPQRLIYCLDPIDGSGKRRL